MFAKLTDRKEKLDEVTFVFKNLITFEVDADAIRNGIPESCELTISEWSPDRNKDQNGKYWATVGEIARLTGASKTEVHNQLLNDYGEMEMVDGEPVVVVMRESFNYLADEDLHLMPTGKMFTDDGVTYAIYYKLKNSKNMTRKEFARLLDGAIYEKGQCSF